MDTVLRSRSKTVTIGREQPFCIIGERINPTGRKKFAEELRGGDLSTVSIDAVAQVEAGADMLDINAGIPLVDEPELLKSMLTAGAERRRRADLHRLVGDRSARGRAVGVRGPGARQLGHGRGRAAGGDPAAGRALRRRGDRARQRRDRDSRDAAEATRARAQDRQRGRRPRDRDRGRRDRPARDDGRRRYRGGDDDARDDQADPRRAGGEHVPRRVERVVRASATGRAQRARSCRWRWPRA